MTVQGTVEFMENKDTSSIAYTHFNQNPIDRYPTFTLCLKGREIYWRDEEILFGRAGVTSSDYVQMLNGRRVRYDGNETRRGDVSDVAMINFDRHSLKASDFIIAADLMAENKSHNQKYISSSTGVGVTQHHPFHVGYQSSDKICFTRNSTDKLDLIRNHDTITLDKSFIMPGVQSNLEMIAFVHYPGHLLRNFEKPIFRSTLGSYDSANTLELKISHITTLIKRSDSNVQCNDTIKNDDLHFRQEVVRKIGCIPVYWKNIMLSPLDVGDCHSSGQLRDAAFLIENYKDVLGSYDPPCEDMTTLVTINNNLRSADGQFKVIVTYTEDVYQKIETLKLVTFEEFISGVGGFVGIFCGYSILQIPELLEKSLPYLKKYRSESKSSKW